MVDNWGKNAVSTERTRYNFFFFKSSFSRVSARECVSAGMYRSFVGSGATTLVSLSLLGQIRSNSTPVKWYFASHDFRTRTQVNSLSRKREGDEKRVSVVF